MPRMRSSTLEYPTTRLRLPPRGVPYGGPTLARGIKLLYRRNRSGAGTWVVRVANSSLTGAARVKAPYWTKAVGLADDYDPANGGDVLDYGQAQDKAKSLARGESAAGRPVTVDEALRRYARDLTSRGAGAGNETRVRFHLTPALAAKPVALVTRDELLDWRDGLLAKGLAAATVNRTCTGLRRALNFAAGGDARITNRDAFRAGLARLPGANRARRMLLTDAEVWRIVAEAYVIGPEFGLLVEVLAQTGARISQVARLNCCDLKPASLMMPRSYKGAEKTCAFVEVPIDDVLAARLRAACDGRADDEPLLRNAKDTRWHEADGTEQRRPFRLAAERAGLDPDQFTSYALRHSSIVRSLTAGVPESFVAQLHDTSTREMERHYMRWMNRSAGDLARRGLPRRPDNVVVALPVRAA
jgi:integrase